MFVELSKRKRGKREKEKNTTMTRDWETFVDLTTCGRSVAKRSCIIRWPTVPHLSKPPLVDSTFCYIYTMFIVYATWLMRSTGATYIVRLSNWQHCFQLVPEVYRVLSYTANFYSGLAQKLRGSTEARLAKKRWLQALGNS